MTICCICRSQVCPLFSVHLTLELLIEGIVFGVAVAAVGTVCGPVCHILKGIAGAHCGPVVIIEIVLARRQLAQAVVQTQTLDQRAGLADELLKHRVAVLGTSVAEHLDLVELVLADQAAGIPSGAARLGAETCSIGAVADGKRFAVQNFLPVHIGYGNLCRGDQIVIRPLQLEHIFGKFGELPCADHGTFMDDIGREHFGIFAVFRVGVEHEVIDAALQPGANPR